MSDRRLPIPALAALVLGLVTAHLAVSSLRARYPADVPLEALTEGAIRPGQAVRVREAGIAVHDALRVPDLDARDPRGNRAYRYVLVPSPSSGRKLVVLIWRSTFPNSFERDGLLVNDLTGTVRRLPDAERSRVAAGFAGRLDERDLGMYLAELEFEPVSAAVPAAGLASVGLVAAGTVGLGRWRRARRGAGPGVAAPAVPERRRTARGPVVERRRTCPTCGQESPIASRSCQTCRAPVETEYYVAAALPLEGFERFVPVLSGVLGVSEYQATQPLARVHTPIPYQGLEAFHSKGAGASAPLRLASRGIASLVTARALASALEEKGVSAHVIGSDELGSGPFPARAAELRYDDDAVTFVFHHGPDRIERTMAWGDIALILFSAAQPVRGTITLARDIRDGGPADASAYLIDVFERGRPDGVRIAEDSFHRWEFLKVAGSERAADRFGRLMELLESRAQGAELQFVTGAYRGAHAEWRMSFFSRLQHLVGERSGWAKAEGPPRLDGYEVLEKIGEGGMGSVYRARQKRLGRVVALKVISTHLAAQKKFVARFQAEARAVAALDHPNIVQVIDLAESNGRHFMVMEYIEGKTLLRLIRERGRLEEHEALSIGAQVAAALEHAWSRGIVHRDVKPDNVFLTGSVAKLGDWGLAKDLEQDLGLTDTGTAIGTPYYMSPEQARGRRDLDVRSDLYALGATLYHAITGAPPYRGGSPGEVVSKHLTAPVPDPRSVALDVGEQTARLLMRMLAKRPDQRFADVAEARAAIEAALRAAEAGRIVLT